MTSSSARTSRARKSRAIGVVIEKWGIHCGPCIASLPHIEQIAKRGKDKLVVIGAHSQSATDEEVKETVKKHRLSYTITKGASGPVGSGGIPHLQRPPDGRGLRQSRAQGYQGATGTAASGTGTSGLDALRKLQEK